MEARERFSTIFEKVSRSGEKPEPTVKVRMGENDQCIVRL